MNVNAIACAARNGDNAAMGELWRACRRWALLIANRYKETAAQNGAISPEDLEQCAALGVIEAAKSFNADGGASFLSWCSYYIRRECRAALGLVGRPRMEHYSTVSLDAPQGDDEDCTLYDMLPDAGDPHGDAISRMDEAQLIADARAVLAKHPPKEWDMVRRCDIDGHTVRAAADAAGITEEAASRARKAALRHLRASPVMRVYNPYSGHHRGLQSWRNTHTSITEASALWNIEHRPNN